MYLSQYHGHALRLGLTRDKDWPRSAYWVPLSDTRCLLQWGGHDPYLVPKMDGSLSTQGRQRQIQIESEIPKDKDTKFNCKHIIVTRRRIAPISSAVKHISNKMKNIKYKNLHKRTLVKKIKIQRDGERWVYLDQKTNRLTLKRWHTPQSKRNLTLLLNFSHLGI